MIAPKTLKLSLKSLRDFAKKRLPDQTLIELDARDECPVEIVRHMCSPDKLGIQLLFIPEEFGGFGGGAFDVYLVCEEPPDRPPTDGSGGSAAAARYAVVPPPFGSSGVPQPR